MAHTDPQSSMDVDFDDDFLNKAAQSAPEELRAFYPRFKSLHQRKYVARRRWPAGVRVSAHQPTDSHFCFIACSLPPGYGTSSHSRSKSLSPTQHLSAHRSR